MTSGKTLSLFGIMLLGLQAAWASTDAVERIVEKIETPRDIEIAFTERRTNALFAEPLSLSGTVLFSTDGVLIKTIGSPVSEQLKISPESIEFLRDGKLKRVGLNRRPDVKAFYTGLQALLDGNYDTLFKTFDVHLDEDDQSWQLSLTPKKKKLRKFVSLLLISGRGNLVDIVRTEQPGGDWQEMMINHASL